MSMKITVGLGRLEDLPDYRRAGADECYAGFVPSAWMEEAGEAEPFNRREVSFVNVQIGTESELAILSDMARDLAMPAAITLNSPFYRPERVPMLLSAIRLCMEYGFSSFIVADPALLYRIREEDLPGIRLHLSGEYGTMNRYVLARARSLGISRVIFPRRTGIPEIRSLVRRDAARCGDAPMEFEAFAMNELCHYDGAYCMGLHCDAFPPACRRQRHLLRGEEMQEDIPDVPGATGCGICSLYALQEAGVTHLKVVSRGERTAETIRDIEALAKARDLAAQSENEKAYLARVKPLVFPDGCSGNCYYQDE